MRTAPLAGSELDCRPVPREALAPDGVVSESVSCQSGVVSNAVLSRAKFSHKQGPPDAYSGGPLLCEANGPARFLTNEGALRPSLPKTSRGLWLRNSLTERSRREARRDNSSSRAASVVWRQCAIGGCADTLPRPSGTANRRLCKPWATRLFASERPQYSPRVTSTCPSSDPVNACANEAFVAVWKRKGIRLSIG